MQDSSDQTAATETAVTGDVVEAPAETFYARPILNSPYEYPDRHWELDESNRPTNRIVDTRRPSAYVSPIPKPRKQQAQQLTLVTDETAKAVATDDQQYELTRFINGVRQAVDQWRRLPESGWRVTPETARLLRHWRHHAFADIRPFFCQVDAVETVIWLTEVAPKLGKEGREYLEHLADANSRATAEHATELNRLALKLATGSSRYEVQVEGETFTSGQRWRGMTPESMARAIRSGRIKKTGRSISFIRLLQDSPAFGVNNIWTNIGGVMSRSDPKIYVVQTSTAAIQRCLLMSTDPGDLVLDPTCGSGTTAYVAEQWGRRWITIDTSRVALALARARIMGARYPYYLLADSPEGQRKEADVTRKAPSEEPTHGDVRQGFVYERVPHITLKSIANNTEIDVIWERWQETLEPLRADLNAALDRTWAEWEIPREAGEPWPARAADAWEAVGQADTEAERMAALRVINTELDRGYTLDGLLDAPRDPWPSDVTEVHRLWWEARIARQQEIDASIGARAEVEYLYDKPYEDRKKVRVAGPFTVESLSPHRLLALNDDDELIDRVADRAPAYGTAEDFAAMVLGHLATTGVQQAHKADRITFSSVDPWPGERICAQGRYTEGEEGPERRAGILVGPEFGTVARQELVRGAREAAEAGFDVLVACAFNFEPHTTEFNKLGALPVLKARMNADLHMADDLANTGKGNLFVIFGEPDIEILPANDEDPETGRVQVKVHGVDVFHPSTGEVRSDGADGIACWFIDTDYNDESFFVRHAYFLGANDPYKALKTTLKAEVDADAWATLHSDTSRPFGRPESGRIAVKVINHLGDEVMKVFQATSKRTG